MIAHFADGVFALFLLGGISGLLVWILRGAEVWGGRPSAAIIGGLLAGVLLGPQVAGTIYARAHEGVWRGGLREHDALRETLRVQTGEIAAMVQTGASDDDIKTARARHAGERAPLAEAWRRQKAAREGAFRAVAVGLALLILAWALLGRADAPLVFRDHLSRPDRVGAALGGLLSFGVPLVSITAFATLVLRQPVVTAACAGAAGGCGTCLLFPSRWIPLSGRSARIVRTSVIAFGCACGSLAILLLVRDRRPSTVVLSAALLAWPCALLLPRFGPKGGRAVRLMREGLLAVLIPACAALVVSRIDLNLLAGWRPLVFVVLVIGACTDGRWVGAAFAWRISRARPGIGPTSADLASETLAAGAGLTQVVLVGVLYGAGVAGPSTPAGAAMLVALLLPVAILEPAIGVWRSVSRALGDRLFG